MCHTTISGTDDDDNMEEISSTSLPSSNKKNGKHIEPRKIRKPLMEKKRRARINQSLDELKRIVVDAEKFAGQDLSRVNKLEKADILEMTVRYLKRKSTTSTPLPPPPPPGPEIYAAGYRRCIGQVQELLAEQWTDERRQMSGQRMILHLESCAKRLDAPANRLSLSSTSSPDEPPSTNVAVINNNNICSSSSSCSSDEDDGTATTEFRRDATPAKLMWRPW